MERRGRAIFLSFKACSALCSMSAHFRMAKRLRTVYGAVSYPWLLQRGNTAASTRWQFTQIQTRMDRSRRTHPEHRKNSCKLTSSCILRSGIASPRHEICKTPLPPAPPWHTLLTDSAFLPRGSRKTHLHSESGGKQCTREARALSGSFPSWRQEGRDTVGQRQT